MVVLRGSVRSGHELEADNPPQCTNSGRQLRAGNWIEVEHRVWQSSKESACVCHMTIAQRKLRHCRCYISNVVDKGKGKDYWLKRWQERWIYMPLIDSYLLGSKVDIILLFE